VFVQKLPRFTTVFVFGACFAMFACSSETEDCETTRSCAPEAASGEATDHEPDHEEGEGGGSSVPTSGADTGEAGAAPDASGNCDGGLTACAARCVDTTSNSNHCGSCGNACAVGSVCTESECAACPDDQVACDGQCIDPNADSTYCGASADCQADSRGLACADGQACSEGACVSDDAGLASLSLEPATLTPAFRSDKRAYVAELSFLTSHLELKASPTSADASMACVDATFTQDDSVSIVTTPDDEVDAVQVDVTAASGKQASYEVQLKRRPLVSTYAKAFNSREGFRFGTSVAISGDTAVFGAPDEDGSSRQVDANEDAAGVASAGAAYVAVRDASGNWVRQAYLKPDVAEENARFGNAVAIDGDTIAVAAPGADEGYGAVFVFIRQGSKWYRADKLTELPRAKDSGFGTKVAVETDRVVVSAPISSLYNPAVGVVYSYTKVGIDWMLDSPRPFSPEEVLTDAGYGTSLSMSGGRLAIAERYGTNSVFVLKPASSSARRWAADGTINLPLPYVAGAEVALDGDTLAVVRSEGVHIYDYVDGTWLERDLLEPFVPAAVEGFGASIAMKDDLLVVGSACEACKGGISTFIRKGESWSNGNYLTANDLDIADGLGFSVAVSADRIVAGAAGEDGKAKGFNGSVDEGAADSGAAYIFE
jgi:hypothetical protein